jgi:hypothetical protein
VLKKVHQGALTLPGAKKATDVAVVQVLPTSIWLSVSLVEWWNHHSQSVIEF